MADKKPSEIARINQEYITDFFTLLTFIIQEGEAEQEEEKFQQQLRDAKRRR